MSYQQSDVSLFASTAQGLEELLKCELKSLGAEQCKVVQGGVYFNGSPRLIYQSLLWSRLASRILLPLSEFRVNSDSDLYTAVNALSWPEIFSIYSTFMVHFNGTNEYIRDSQYGALKVKDAIVDCFMSQLKKRPDVDKKWPDIRINVFLHRNMANISLDLSGESLHQRGYRQEAGLAPLKENLAAAIILRSDWQLGSPMIDPMCGSGTLLIEAAMMASDIAPGLKRTNWGFNAWKGHDDRLWQKIVKEAQLRAKHGLHSVQSRFYGYDHNADVLAMAKNNASRAGVAELITFQEQKISQLSNPMANGEKGTVISNPPYGERLASEPELIALYNLLGRILKHSFAGWNASLVSASSELLNSLQLRASRQFNAMNGPLPCIQKNYQLAERSLAVEPPDSFEKKTLGIDNIPIQSIEIAVDFANRLAKNVRKFKKWADSEGLQCYRIYDADLPDYNVAIDCYANKVVVQEYAAPKTIDAQKARQRLFDIIQVTTNVLKLQPDELILKVRERQKGKNQYEKLAEKGNFLLVTEYNAKFWLNLTDYLDTGLFLDHRLVRRFVSQLSQDKHFLNLFAYTGSASVHAGLAGAKTTTTIDMSRTYLEWAERNLRENGLIGQKHRLIQADCLRWLSETNEKFDLIFIDPPTFSNSKRMEHSFDVQRDYLDLMFNLKRLLSKEGIIIFSNNKRGFKMDLAGIQNLDLIAEDISKKTVSIDFVRHRQMHHCWLLQHKHADLGGNKLCH